MRNSLAEAVAELHLEPGQTYRTMVDDVEIQLHRPAVAQPEKPSPFADMDMLEPGVDLGPPPSKNSAIVIATRREPIVPSRITIDPSDFAPNDLSNPDVRRTDRSA